MLRRGASKKLREWERNLAIYRNKRREQRFYFYQERYLDLCLIFIVQISIEYRGQTIPVPSFITNVIFGSTNTNMVVGAETIPPSTSIAVAVDTNTTAAAAVAPAAIISII